VQEEEGDTVVSSQGDDEIIKELRALRLQLMMKLSDIKRELQLLNSHLEAQSGGLEDKGDDV
jgi:hypothetical protein